MSQGIVVLIFLILNFSSFSESKKSWNGLRPQEDRESFAIQTAIKLYNVTMNFDQKLKNAYNIDNYEDILNNDGVKLKEEMDGLEGELLEFLKAIESAGGVMPKTENITNEIDEFVTKMELGYNTMVKNTKVFAEKMIGGLKSVQTDKQRLLHHSQVYADFRKTFQNSRGILEQEKIFLRNPDKDSEPVKLFDISVLETLYGYYKELDEIEDKISPIIDKYASMDAMDRSTDEYKTIKESKRAVKKINLLKIVPVIEENDNMLRHYEQILTKEIDEAQEMLKAYDVVKSKIMKVAMEMGDQDVRIRELYNTQFNGFLMKANEEALARATKIKQERERLEEFDDHDEL